MRKGFTLVEILIVILVMSILGAMMTFSGSEAMASSEASKIVAKLRNLKIAAMQMYVDKLDLWESSKDDSDNKFNMTELKKYLNDDNGYDDFVIVTSDNTSTYANRKWYAAYNFDAQAKDAGKVKEKLVKRAVTDDLLGFTVALVDNGTCVPIKPYNGHAVVLLQIR